MLAGLRVTQPLVVADVIALPDADATEDFGRKLAGRLRQGDVVALYGDLGAGKTTLARGLLAGLGFAGDVASPTFPIVQAYDDLPFRSGMSTSTGSRIAARSTNLRWMRRCWTAHW
jgi:hypothetical protein